MSDCVCVSHVIIRSPQIPPDMPPGFPPPPPMIPPGPGGPLFMTPPQPLMGPVRVREHVTHETNEYRYDEGGCSSLCLRHSKHVMVD